MALGKSPPLKPHVATWMHLLRGESPFPRDCRLTAAWLHTDAGVMGMLRAGGVTDATRDDQWALRRAVRWFGPAVSLARGKMIPRAVQQAYRVCVHKPIITWHGIRQYLGAVVGEMFREVYERGGWGDLTIGRVETVSARQLLYPSFIGLLHSAFPSWPMVYALSDKWAALLGECEAVWAGTKPTERPKTRAEAAEITCAEAGEIGHALPHAVKEVLALEGDRQATLAAFGAFLSACPTAEACRLFPFVWGLCSAAPKEIQVTACYAIARVGRAIGRLDDVVDAFCEALARIGNDNGQIDTLLCILAAAPGDVLAGLRAVGNGRGTGEKGPAGKGNGRRRKRDTDTDSGRGIGEDWWTRAAATPNPDWAEAEALLAPLKASRREAVLARLRAMGNGGDDDAVGAFLLAAERATIAGRKIGDLVALVVAKDSTIETIDRFCEDVFPAWYEARFAADAAEREAERLEREALPRKATEERPWGKTGGKGGKARPPRGPRARGGVRMTSISTKIGM
ncbi:MAG: hypothetical protein HY543_09925 [Deltaproteobacteria bacterium]|nr:hypothetical protein [Deltaproteobacteria bacterium]